MVMLNSFQHLTACLYFPPSLDEILKFAIEREQSQACLSYAEPTNETRAEDACILCLVRRRKTKST